MKKLLLPFITMVTLAVNAQVPATPLAGYEFTNGSLQNVQANSFADLSGNTITSVDDRFASVNDAADLGNVLTGFSVGATNIMYSTLSLWMKHAPMTGSTEVIAEIFDAQPNGYRLSFDGDSLIIFGQATGSLASDMVTPKFPADIDDNQWHHIIVRTVWGANNTESKIEIYVDGTAINPVGSNIIQPYPDMVSFIRNATFKLTPFGNYTGEIDDVYFYNRSLTVTEMTQLRNYNPNPLPRYYVDVNAAGNNNGTSWADAFVDLEDALNVLGTGTEVWVADGTYRITSSNRSATYFWEQDSIKLYGGFAGGETAITQRDWIANKTILSGDLGVIGDNSDNAYATFVGPYGSPTNILNYSLVDGFVMQDGRSDAQGGHGFGTAGAGVYTGYYIKKMDFHNCEFSNSISKYGAFYSYAEFNDVELNIDACIFKNNSSRIGMGMLVESKGHTMNLNVTNCLFSENTSIDLGSSLGLGAVIYLEAKNLSATNINAKFTNSTFANNSNNGTHASNFKSTIIYYDAATSGGSKHLDINNCIFWGNTGDTVSVKQNPNGSAYNTVDINNTISEFTTFPAAATTTNLIFNDPLFTDVSNDDFTLQSSSPAVDAGSQVGLTISLLDLAGNTRVSSTEIDLGCYESTHTPGGSGGGVGISEGSQSFELLPYPNPTTGIVNFRSENEIENIKVYNLSGQKVMAFNHSNTINISSLPKGIYTAKVITKSSKLVIVKLIRK